ncbi:MAG: PadR family transcriptional regulator [Clostridia bacterium]|nr:PadR family transcriptional regulator [Clostridia bacterium]
MSLKHTILGFLSWKPMTGYELKKFFAETEFIYWSGNNNQIYKTLVELGAEGFVEKVVVQQENYPAKKIYHITGKGLSEVREWAMGRPEPPSARNSFLMQLAWSDGLSEAELLSLIDSYQYEIEMKHVMCKEKLRRKSVYPGRNERERYIWEMLWQNRINAYRCELDWLTALRNGLDKKDGMGGGPK